jgi:L-lactate dehydrogenase
VFLGVPCIVDRQGVREVLKLTITDKEKEQLHMSANKLKGLIETIS